MTQLRKGGRPRVGSTFIKDNVRQLAVTTDRPGAKRARWVRPCPRNDDGSPMSEVEARATAAKLQRLYDAEQWDPWAPAPAEVAPTLAPALETFGAWCGRWCDAREAAGLHSVKDDRTRMRLHVLPLIGEVPVATITRAQLEDVRDALDVKARAGELATATAIKVWGLVTKAFSDARASKNRTLRARDDNPALDIEPPDREAERAGTFLYPSELVALVTCSRVPLRWRRLFAVAAYTGLRAGELEALAWSDVDLERGIIHVHQAADRETGEVRETKTGITRRFALERGIVPALRAMHAEAKGQGRVFLVMPPREDGAAYLRTCLGYAGVTRAELFARTKTQRPVVFHDLRASYLTWLAVRGDEPIKIMQRAGHTSFATTQGYVRAGEALRGDGFGELFAELRIEAPAGGSATPAATEKDETPESLATSEGFPVTPTGFEGAAQVGSVRQGSESFGNRAGEGARVGPLRTGRGGFATGSATAVAGPFDPRAVALSLRAALALPYHDADAAWLAAEAGGLS